MKLLALTTMRLHRGVEMDETMYQTLLELSVLTIYQAHKKSVRNIYQCHRSCVPGFSLQPINNCGSSSVYKILENKATD